MLEAAEDDFAAECREAFGHHVAELAKIDVRQPGHREANATRRADLIHLVDKLLDDYLLWQELHGVSAHTDAEPS